MKLIMILSVLLCASASSFATTMKIDEKASVITWRGEKKVGAKHFGTIQMVANQTLEFENGMPNSGEILIDMDTIFDQDLEKGSAMHKKLMEHLRSKDFFKVKKYKHSKLIILGGKLLNKTQMELSTELTIKKETRPLKITMDISRSGNTWTGKSNFAINRKDWKLTYGSNWFNSKLDKIIKDTIKFEVVLVLTK